MANDLGFDLFPGPRTWPIQSDQPPSLPQASLQELSRLAMILVFSTCLTIFKLNFNFNFNLLMFKKKCCKVDQAVKNLVHIVLNPKILWVSIFLVSIRKSECSTAQPSPPKVFFHQRSSSTEGCLPRANKMDRRKGIKNNFWGGNFDKKKSLFFFGNFWPFLTYFVSFWPVFGWINRHLGWASG